MIALTVAVTSAGTIGAAPGDRRSLSPLNDGTPTYMAELSDLTAASQRTSFVKPKIEAGIWFAAVP